MTNKSAGPSSLAKFVPFGERPNRKLKREVSLLSRSGAASPVVPCTRSRNYRRVANGVEPIKSRAAPIRPSHPGGLTAPHVTSHLLLDLAKVAYANI
jgi:hypothetical protein